jgi:acyl dehydratase
LSIHDSIVGIRLPPVTRNITWRETAAFAAAVGEDLPAYLDDGLGDGALAPPLFAVAVTWPLLESLPNHLGGALPPEVVATLVHAGERLLFRRPLRPDQALTLEAQVVALASTRAGALLTLRVDARGEDGNPTFTEWLEVLFRGVQPEGAGRSLGPEHLASPPAVPPMDEKPTWQLEIPVPRGLPFVYDACTGISFPIHTSVSFARSVGLPDLILHGTAALALCARELVAREAGGDPTRLKEIGCRFRGVMVPGAPLDLKTWVGGPGHARSLGFTVYTSDGRPALVDGVARLG